MDGIKVLPKKEVKHPQPSLKQDTTASAGICNF